MKSLKGITVTLLILVVTLMVLRRSSVETHAADREMTPGGGGVNAYGMPALTPEEEAVILRKGTERAFSGKSVGQGKEGRYRCRQCGLELFDAGAKFDSRTGWPSFDAALPGAVREVPDRDGERVEIVCSRCSGHLGHVFRGEGISAKNTRHCVNSLSLAFCPLAAEEASSVRRAVFAGGCFWGVEYYLEQHPGVKSVTSGYTGGSTERPTYEEVCHGKGGHIEAVEVLYDSTVVTYDALARLFFEIHDPTQLNRQGPDRGEQYRSEIFYWNEEEKQTAEKLIGLLSAKGFEVKTRVSPLSVFWPAEKEHQNYYVRTGKTPYCHRRVKRFE